MMTDPWAGKGGHVGSRTVSGAIGRLKRKGYVQIQENEYALTPAGRDELDKYHPTGERRRKE
jgi:Mn-dependent DtxR family transcriptional regulator